MFVCWKCGAVDVEPLHIPATRDNPEEYICQVCRAPWDGEEAKKCDLCGEYKHPNDMASAHCCKACADAAAKDEAQFTKFLADDDIEDEFFAEFIMSKEDLIAAGKAKFAKMSKAERMAKIKDFISGDELFHEWLEAQV